MDNFTPDMSEKLVLYLDGELIGTDKNNLEQQLATDKVMQDRLESLQSTRAAIKLYGLKERVAGIHMQMMEEIQTPVKKMSSSRKNIRYSIAVAASLLLLIGSYLAYNFFTLSSEKVFASNYNFYELSTVRDGNGQTPALIEDAYINKEYATVISIVFDRPFTAKEFFLRALSYVELGNNSNAIAEFKQVLSARGDEKNDLLKSEAEYYLALTYVRNKDYDFALELLHKINDDPTHIYHEKVSAKLIRQVKMLKWR